MPETCFEATFLFSFIKFKVLITPVIPSQILFPVHKDALFLCIGKPQKVDTGVDAFLVFYFVHVMVL